MGKIILKNLHKSFGNKQVLKDLSFDIPLGEKTAIMGPSGAGKTSLLRILIGLDDDFTGEIYGLDNLKKSFVFQEERLIEHLNPIDNIRMVNDHLDFDYIKVQMDKVGLSDSYDKKVKELSGGMKRRVSLLRGLLYDFDIIFLDEPFKGLDVDTKTRVCDYIKKEYRKKTIVLVSHDLDEIKMMDIKNIIEIEKII